MVVLIFLIVVDVVLDYSVLATDGVAAAAAAAAVVGGATASAAVYDLAVADLAIDLVLDIAVDLVTDRVATDRAVDGLGVAGSPIAATILEGLQYQESDLQHFVDLR